jgi:hypothetical protein
VVVGRHQRENEFLASCGVKGVLLTTVDHPGPTTLVPGEVSRQEIESAARITAGYSDGGKEPAVRVQIRSSGMGGDGEPDLLIVRPTPRDESQALMV